MKNEKSIVDYASLFQYLIYIWKKDKKRRIKSLDSFLDNLTKLTGKNIFFNINNPSEIFYYGHITNTSFEVKSKLDFHFSVGRTRKKTRFYIVKGIIIKNGNEYQIVFNCDLNFKSIFYSLVLITPLWSLFSFLVSKSYHSLYIAPVTYLLADLIFTLVRLDISDKGTKEFLTATGSQ